MVDKKISDFTEVTSVGDTDWLEVETAAGNSRKVKKSNLVPIDVDGVLAANSDTKIASQKAVKTYVDAQLAKIASRKVRAASTVAITLATGCENGDTIDGVTLATGDRVLLKNQSSAAENGIWVVAASGAPTRATDADSSAELVNISVWVSEGTINADTLWTCTTDAPITVGTTAITFASIATGSVSLASTTDVLTGTDTTKAASPDALAALWEQGTDVASAATVTLGEGGYFRITGSTAITDIDFATDKPGRKAWVRFAGTLTLTHNATTLILPTGANITTAAGDMALFVSEGSDVVRCLAYSRADGTPLAGGGGGGGGSGGVQWVVDAVGTGASQSISLPASVANDLAVLVFVNGLHWGDAEYDVAGTTLTITSNASGDAIRIVGVATAGITSVGITERGLTSPTDDYTLVAGDRVNYVRMNKATAVNLTVPPNASVAFALCTEIPIFQKGAGQVTIVAGSGVTINTPETLKLRRQYSTALLTKVGTNEWDLTGDLELAP